MATQLLIYVFYMSKVFDRVNHYAVFIKLMDRNVFVALMNILIHWYGICTSFVRWDSAFSYVICLQYGVRQGGVLST